MNKPDGISDEAWAIAVAHADRDRATLARLVKEGKVFIDRDAKYRLPLQPAVNLAIKPNKKRKRK